MAAIIRHYTTLNGLPTNEVWQIIQLPNKQILIQSTGTFCIFNGKEFETVSCGNACAYKLPTFANYGILTQGDSLLWLRDFYNIYLFDTRTNIFRTDISKRLTNKKIIDFVNNKNAKPHFDNKKYQAIISQLPNKDNIHPTSAYTDHEGGVWITTINDGIYYWNKPKAKSFSINIPNINSIAVVSEHEIIIGRSNDILLFDTKSKTVTKTIATNTDLCHDISVDKDKTVWISTNKGLYQYKNGVTKLFNQQNTHGLAHSIIRFAQPIDNNRLLICNLNNILGYFYPSKGIFVSLYKQLPILSKYRVIVGCKQIDKFGGQYLIYTQNGMFVLNTKTNKLVKGPIFGNKYNCIYTDSQKRIWAGTPNGLTLLGKHERTFNKHDGLANSYIKSITEDTYGNIWIGTAMGIAKMTMSKNDTCFVNYYQTDGMPNAMMTERGCVTMPSGEIWMTDKDGLTEIFPKLFQGNDNSQAVIITDISTDNHTINSNEQITLKYNDNSISIKFSTLNFSIEGETRYRYRLLGLDNKWTIITSTGMGIANFKYLQPGKYTFEVEAAYDNGPWGQATIKAIQIEPPLWLTWYAQTFYILAVLLFIILALRQYLKKQAQKLAKKNDEKVNKLFELRSNARHQFAQNMNISPEKLTVNKTEEELMNKLLNAIEANMGNTEYTVDQLASDVCLSRSNLYRRMQAMLGITPNDFLRSVRLKRAAKLLSETTMPISEISLAVGFCSPRYFSQYFKKMFGVTPTEYAARVKEE